MHFIIFPAASTHIFPLVNSTKGGQLVTEYNLKSREMVATNPEVKYAIGPSFIHSLDDFRVRLLTDVGVPEYDDTSTYEKGDYCTYLNNTYVCIVNIPTPEPFDVNHWVQTEISGSIIQIDPGRAVINGHYIESVAPVTIDLALVNADLKRAGQPQLYGNLSIGFKTYFSTSNTMSGSMKVENTDDMYIGIQLVIEQSTNFKTPADEPTDQSKVTADLKLADFTYVNGVVATTSIKMSPDATRYISVDRIADFGSVLSDEYVKSSNLVDRMFYTFSGKTGWCDSTGSIMVWDKENKQVTTPPVVEEANFYTYTDGSVHLVIPHKQQDAEILNDNDERLYYESRDIQLPTADYNSLTSGIVTSTYTQRLHELESILGTYKEFTNGKQIAYWETLSFDSNGDYTPEFMEDLSGFDIGDYILVRKDFTVSSSDSAGTAPSTMYFVVPGGVTSVVPENITTTKPSGVKLGVSQVWWSAEHASEPTTTSPTAEELLTMFGYTTYQGGLNDYFELEYHYSDEMINPEHATPKYFYYPVSSTGPKTWSGAVLLTGGVPLATTSMIGGFYNMPTSSEYTDAGYVYLDSNGHLRLMDYALLRSGTLAYQLGSDYKVPSNQTLNYIQSYLDENVNDRIAFKSQPELTTTATMMDVYIPLPEGGGGTLNIYDIDSRFGTGVYLHFMADDSTGDYSDIVINIINCEKVRIDSSVTKLIKGPIINVFRTCLYYDASVINYIRLCDINNQRAVLFPNYTDFTGFDGLTLWYSRFSTSDPDLVVNGMEISQPNVAMVTQEIDFWSDTVPGDNHYRYALRSITLSNVGKMIACSLYVSNGSTKQITTAQHFIIGGDFIIPQGADLNYPEACVNNALKVTGTFTTAYLDSRGEYWITTETSFTALSGIYSPTTGMAKGSIAFNSTAELIPASYTNVETIDGWAPNSYHIFYGGTTV